MATKTNGNAAVTWHSLYDAAFAQVDAGPAPSDAAYRACLILGSPRGKRPGAEALMVAMALRPMGATTAQYQAVRVKAGETTGLSQNHLSYCCAKGGTSGFNGQGQHARGMYGVISVMPQNKAFIARLTPKGAAMLKAAGMNAGDIASLSKALPKGQPAPKPAPVAAKAASPAKAPAKATVSPKGKAKPKGQPIQAPAAQPAPQAPQAPRTVLTEAGPKPLKSLEQATHELATGQVKVTIEGGKGDNA